ncbi:MAG: kinase-like domain-containing protein [Monoraphidium minutum]|nr:MAG: kinase-like domain-containing protein [Monoraphidium minutum]
MAFVPGGATLTGAGAGGAADNAPFAAAAAAAKLAAKKLALGRGAPISICVTAVSAAAGDGGGDGCPATPSGDLAFEELFHHGASRRTSMAEPTTPVTPRCGGAPVGGADCGAAADDPMLATWPRAVPASRPVPCAGSSAASDASTAGSGGADAAAVEQARFELRCDGPVERCAATGMPAETRVGPEDFEILRVVGQGAFGKVFQVRQRSSGRLYAMKVMRKERILQRDHGDYVRAERDVLTAVLHPYIVALRFSFQTPSKLYLVLDFMNGGHLFFNLYRAGVFDEPVARLYTAEIVSALSYLHSRNIVHRDLKPENVLLDSEGHVRLTDFGLAKDNMGEGSRTNSFIGTMEYMAPEIIEAKGHDKGVDWWSTGILLFEMLAGQPPFRAKSRQVLQQQITSGKIKWPKFLSPAALALLKGLLTRDPSKRLGAGPGGSAAIRAHPFFKGINWAALEERRVPSSFKPSLAHSASVENFDALWTGQAPEDSPCGTPTDPSLAAAFEGFTYVAPSFLAGAMAALAAGGGAAGAAAAAAAAAATAGGAA